MFTKGKTPEPPPPLQPAPKPMATDMAANSDSTLRNSAVSSLTLLCTSLIWAEIWSSLSLICSVT